MFAAASSFFSRSNISQNYTIGTTSNGSRTATPTPAGSSSLPSVALVPPFHVGLWRVQSATHKVTSKRVSVWSFEKRGPEMERTAVSAKEQVLEVLKTEVSSLSKLRHPCILEMVEPLEDTRSELVFATEPLLSSLHLAIPGSPNASSSVDLDEVEIQKGILQLCKGLAFLHTSARIVHSNITPESILINNSGDWKIGGLGLTLPLQRPDGSPTQWEFPSFDSRISPYVQRSFDYIAPEYVLDEVLDTASDMYSLGCLMYAVHCKGNPPFKNFANLGSLREHAGQPLSGMERLDRDLQMMLSSLITRQPHSRPSPTTLPTHAFFSSLPISTLNFLDRSNFAAKSREEKISFMKGLTSVLERFSEGLRIRKILPSLVEEMKDTHLLPYILPNVFAVSKVLSPQQFVSLVLPSLKPLFVIKEPPQNMLTLLDNLDTLQSKTEKNIFREHVLPLVYNALESENALVQERALKAVPDLCETIDYAEVQGVLFPRVALVFSKTRILSVKVATLVTFLSMVKTLDQSSLTQKLVPLLSKIRTKEPAVMMATLSVQDAMGMKVDREAVATLVLPQLWATSIGPLLNLEQFHRFMAVIKKLGDRVEKEHNQFLRDSHRIEDRSSIAMNGVTTSQLGGSVDFASLVSGVEGATVKADTVMDGNTSWDDDVWGSILAPNPETPRAQSPAPMSSSQVPIIDHQQQPRSLPSSPNLSTTPSSFRPSPAYSGRGLGAKPISPTSFNSTAFASTSQSPRPPFSSISTAMQPMQPNHTSGSLLPQSSSVSIIPPPPKPNYHISLSDLTNNAPPRPTYDTSLSSSVLRPTPMQPPSQPQAPNYNISFSNLTSSAPAMSSPPIFTSPPSFTTPSFAPPPASSTLASRPAMANMLTPSKPQQPAWGNDTGSKPASKDVWSDFDPLS